MGKLTPPIIKRLRWSLLFKHQPDGKNEYKYKTINGSYSLNPECRIALAILTLQGYENDHGIVRVGYNTNYEKYRIVRHTYLELLDRGFISVYEIGGQRGGRQPPGRGA